VIRIRPGRSWRLNPAYVGEIRSAKPMAFTGADVLDVLGIEIDGVDLAAGLGEARVLVAVDELAQAVLALTEGAVAAQATVGRGPTELVLEARGTDVALSLVALAPPCRMLASGLIVPAARLRVAAAAAASAVHDDLLAISGSLRNAPLARRLAAASGALASAPRRKPRPWPRATARPVHVAVTAGGVQLSIEVPETSAARLAGMRAVANAPLAAHLGGARARLQAKSVPGLEVETPALLLLRNLLRDAAALADSWESGDRRAELHFGPHALQVDLARDELRAPGFSHPASIAPLDLCAAIADAAFRYTEAFRADDDFFADLRERALRLAKHVRDLESGDLRRAPEVVQSPPRREARPRSQPLSRGSMRRLVYREAWSARVPGALRVFGAAHRVLVELPDALIAYDVSSGREAFRAAAAPGAVVRGESLFLSDATDAVARLDAHSGAQRWRRRLRGATHPARVFALPFGVARTLPGEGLAVVTDAGALAFRQKLPGGAPIALSAEDGALIAALPSQVVGLDPSDGRVLWRRKLRATMLFGSIAVAETAVVALDAHTGTVRWQQTMPIRAACVSEDLIAVLSGDRVLGLSLADGTQKLAVALPWAEDLRAGDEGEPSFVATGPTSAACIRGGAVAWRRDLATTPAQVQRHIALVGAQLVDLRSGQLLAELPGPAVLGSDLSCARLTDGTVSVHRLAGHFSVL
jgi:hypothetical protein